MSPSNERLKILEMIDQGVISAEEGFNLLQALDGEQDLPLGISESTPKESASDEPPLAPDLQDIDRWKRFWFIPLWIGVGITTLSTGLMYWAWRVSGFGIWFACAWVPFFLGVMVLALAWGSQTSPWLHVRVNQKSGETPEKIAISFPIPIRFSAWVLRTFGHWIPNLDDTGLDEILLALGDSALDNTPFFVDVKNDEDGERVQVFIG
jgi:hypothetical protein